MQPYPPSSQCSKRRKHSVADPRTFANRSRVMALPTHGTMAVEWEQRVDFDRLRQQRLARAKDLLAEAEVGAVLCVDMNSVGELTATHIATCAQDMAKRVTLLPENDDRR